MAQDAGTPEAGPLARPWEYAETTDGIRIMTRSVPHTEIKECLAEATFEGNVREYRDVVSDVANFPSFMPFIKEGRVIRQEDGGVVITYVRLELPWPLSPRDYVARRVHESEPDADGNGTFRSRWSIKDDEVPPKRGTIRIPRNDGFWEITTVEPGKVRVRHGFVVHPGGNVPIVAVNYGNRTGIPDMFKAIHKEAARRRALKGNPTGSGK